MAVEERGVATSEDCDGGAHNMRVGLGHRAPAQPRPEAAPGPRRPRAGLEPRGASGRHALARPRAAGVAMYKYIH